MDSGNDSALQFLHGEVEAALPESQGLLFKPGQSVQSILVCIMHYIVACWRKRAAICGPLHTVFRDGIAYGSIQFAARQRV